MGTLTPEEGPGGALSPKVGGRPGGLRKRGVQIAFSAAILGLLTLPLGSGWGAAPPRRRPARGGAAARPPAAGQMPRPKAPEPATAGAYAWPIDAPRRMTSSFGEFRAGHFHGGIDLSTEQRVGRAVYAVADGFVWRVRASGSGYGRAIYLRLHDGRTAVYGHLSAYSPSIAAWVEAAQESLGRYEVDLQPPAGRLPVRRGDRIGASGESGAGPPHLHFEMREGEDGEIGRNPQRLGFLLPDDTAPVIRRLLLDELGTARERACGVGRRRAVALRADGPGRWRALDTLRVAGPALISVETYDPGVSGSRGGPAAAQLSLDGRPVYRVDFDAFDWNRAHEVELCWDQREAAAGHAFVLHLYHPAGARDARFQTSAAGTGWIGPPTGDARGVQRVEVTVEDARGHTARATAFLRWLPERAVPEPGVPAAGADAAALDTLLAPGGAMTLRLGAATLNLGADALFGPARLRLTAGRSGGADTVGGAERPWLRVDAPGVVLDAAVRVSLAPPPAARSERLALYVQRPGRTRWDWVGQESGADGLGGTTRQLGRFELRDDRTAPRVTITAPAVDVAAAPRPAIAATVTDALAGVTWRTIDVTLDQVPQIVVYDPESDTVTGRSRRALAPGLHTLRVVARDRAGNRTVVDRSFRVAS